MQNLRNHIKYLLLLLIPFLLAVSLRITNEGGGNSISVQNTRSNSLTFDGVDDYVDTNDTFQSTFQGSFSISFWIKPIDGQPISTEIPIGSFDSGNDSRIQILLQTTGKLRFTYRSNGNQASAETNEIIFSNGQEIWYFITLVADSTINGIGGLKIYSNDSIQTLNVGVNGDTSGITFGDYTNVIDLYIGARNTDDSDSNHFAGEIVGIHIFNRVFSATEIGRIYRGDIIIDGSVGAWPLQEGGLSEKAYDVSGSDNDGTLTNFTLADGWKYKQNKSLYPQYMGYEAYTDDATGLIEIRVPYKVDESKITPTITGYTKQSDNPGRGYNKSLLNITN